VSRLLLAVETATAVTSAALLRDGELVAEEIAPEGRPAAETLLPAIERLLAGAGIGLPEVAAFAVSIGPGSFTGLRIGLATVKGLVFGVDRPVVPVSTLAALARRAPPGLGPAVAVLDARRGEVYAAAYADGAHEPDPDLPEGVYTAGGLAARLPEHCRMVGEGVAVCAEAVLSVRGDGSLLVPPPAGDPRASEVGALGVRLLARGASWDAESLVPRYVRRAEAEVKRTGERFEGV
jgi:tRNA threonylcarbamoyladenosine biosynthesis protein TsaB